MMLFSNIWDIRECTVLMLYMLFVPPVAADSTIAMPKCALAVHAHTLRGGWAAWEVTTLHLLLAGEASSIHLAAGALATMVQHVLEGCAALS